MFLIRMKSDRLFIVFGLFSMLLFYSYAQQCLDLKPPFIPKTRLPFCRQNSKYGCCTSLDDDGLKGMFDLMRMSVLRNNDSQSNACLGYMKSFLCARCSPLATEIFYGSKTQFGEPLIPGLCGDFCEHFYRRCSNITEHYLATIAISERARKASYRLNLLSRTPHSYGFCKAVSLPVQKSQYCHPLVGSTFGETARFTTDKVKSPSCVCLQPYDDISLTNPVVVTNANDDSQRLFIAEQHGVINSIYLDGMGTSNVFLDIKSRVFHDGNGFSRLGLLGMTFHPNFKQNNRIYVLYTFKKDNSLHVRVEEYKGAGEDFESIDPVNNRVILEFKKETNNHVGGSLLFGKDGYLYIFTGDDGDNGDEMETSQDLFLLPGKVLRINVDVTDFVRGREYSIPIDNPFAGREYEGLSEIYAWGLRDPRGCSTERSNDSDTSRGRIFCGDVGMDTYEEINIINKWGNYGWNLKEGTADFCTDCLRGSPRVNLTEPIFEYRHTIGKSVVGGLVYRGCLNPNLHNQYIFGDFQKGIFRLTEKSNKWTGERLEVCSPGICKSPLTNQIQPFIHAFGEDEHGELYVSTTSSPNLNSPTGRIFKIVDPIRRGNPENCTAARPADGKSAVTGNLYPVLKPPPIRESEPQAQESPLPVTTEQPRTTPATPSRQQPPQQWQTNPEPRTGFFSRMFGRNRQSQNNRARNRQNESPTQNVEAVQSVINRPDVQRAINDIQNGRPVSGTSGSGRPNTANNPSQRNADISEVPTAVDAILRAAGLAPSQPQSRAVSLGTAMPQNTIVGERAVLSQNIPPGLRSRTVFPQNTIVGRSGVLAQPAPANLGSIPPPNRGLFQETLPSGNTGVSIESVFAQNIAAALGGILGQNTAARQGNRLPQNSLAGQAIVLPEDVAAGMGLLPTRGAFAELPRNSPLSVPQITGNRRRLLLPQNSAALPRVAMPLNSATGLRAMLPRNNWVMNRGRLPLNRVRNIGNGAATVNDESDVTVIRLNNK